MKRSFCFLVLSGLLSLSPVLGAPQEGESSQSEKTDSSVSSAQAAQRAADEAAFEAHLAELKEQAKESGAIAVDAARRLAIHYTVSGNVPEASVWMERLVNLLTAESDRGDVASMILLGRFYDEGNSLYPQNRELAFTWFEKAADAGDASAQYQVGFMLDHGIGCERSPERARQYFEKARQIWEKEARKGNTEAALFTGLLYEKNLVADGGPEASVPWLRLAADQGDVRAQCLLALKYRDGQGVPVSGSSAVELFHAAAKKNDLGAIRELGLMYRDGIAIERDPDKARVWFEKGVQAKDPLCMMDLADMLTVEGDDVTALELYKRAASTGMLLAAKKAGIMLKNMNRTEEDLKEAVHYLRQVADQTADPESQYLLGQIYCEQGDEALGVSLIRSAAQAAWLPALDEMAQRHLIPGKGTDWNPVLSYYYWTQAGKLGDEEGTARAAWLLWGSAAVVSLLIALFVWKFYRFAKKRIAEQEAAEQKLHQKDDA